MLATIVKLELPEVARLLSIPDSVLRALALRLREIGLAPPFLSRIARVGEKLDDPLRAPMRVWNARRMREPAAVAARLFMLHDAVGQDEARAALGDLTPLLDGGMLESRGARLVSRLHLALAGEFYCFGDIPGSHADGVPPLCGATLDLARAAIARPDSGRAGGRGMARALDMGCGAGAVALLLSRAALHVVASDVDARAVGYTRLNARINGVANVQAKQGDLWDPSARETFDCVAFQPPFLAAREGAAPSAFVHGGQRGDELGLRMLADCPSHLTPPGRALVLADWPIVEAEPLEMRVRAALGSADADVLVLQSPLKNLDDYCALYAAARSPDLGESFVAECLAQREHLESLSLRGIALALVAVEAAARPEAGSSGWTAHVSVRHPADGPVTAEFLDRLVAAHRLARGPGAALRATGLALPAGTRRVEQPLAGGGSPACIFHPPAGRPLGPVVLEADDAAIVARIAQSPTVGEAARSHAAASGAPLDALSERFERVARDALVRGVLEEPA